MARTSSQIQSINGPKKTTARIVAGGAAGVMALGGVVALGAQKDLSLIHI